MSQIPSPARHDLAPRLSKEQFWRDALRQFQVSDQSVCQFCRTRQLSVRTFFAWRRTLAQRDAGAASPGPVFLPVQLMPENTSGIEIVVAGGHRVRLSGPVDPLALRQVLAVLSAASLPSASLPNGSKPKEGRSC